MMKRKDSEMISIDIFCDVIDNFGDAGVCWRLASIFAKEKKAEVNLYINDPETLSKITSGFNSNCLPVFLDGVKILDWKAALVNQPSSIVIETFGCRIPEVFETRMANLNPQPLWINLEYLSAEEWVEGCHRLPSPHPTLNIQKYFFFPGITKKTGGIMIEEDLFVRQKLFNSLRKEFLGKLNLNPSVFTVFTFCYPSAPLEQFYEALEEDRREINLLLPKGKSTEILSEIHAKKKCPHIHLGISEMVPQEHFDSFLWASDSLIVRGEDSFVRAQLSAKPFIWNIYPQTEETHIKKLEAFENRLKPYLQELFPLWAEINLAWNKNPESLKDLWPKWRDQNNELTQKAHEWRKNLISLGSLTDNLWNFFETKGKS